MILVVGDLNINLKDYDSINLSFVTSLLEHNYLYLSKVTMVIRHRSVELVIKLIFKKFRDFKL